MRDLSSSTHPQSEAIASLRQALVDHQPISRQRSRRPQQRTVNLPNWVWFPLLLLGLMGTGGIGMVALQSLLEPPPIPNCRALSPLAAPAKRLHCAQQLASTGRSAHLVASINMLRSWGPEHSLYSESQALLTDWSSALLENAEDALHVAGLGPAVRLARYIPANSTVYKTAQANIDDWRQQWAEGERVYEEAVAALEQRDWKQASQQVIALGDLDSPYWHQTRANALSLRIIAEQQGHQTVTAAQKMAASQSPDQLAAALVHIQTIAPQTFAQEAAAPLIETWSKAVIEAAAAKQAAGQLEEAVQLVQAVPVDLAMQSDFSQAQDLIRYSHAQRLARQASEQPERWWLLTEAIAAAQAIAPQSDLAERLQPQLSQWRSQLNARGQLQVAQVIASSGQRRLLQFSLAQADAIKADSDAKVPLHGQADALGQRWRHALAQIDGRPYFTLAQQTAKPGTEQALSDAIGIAEPLIASGIEWPQVQQALTDWRSRLQTLEDRPILTQAQQLAADGDFQAAVAKVETIAAGRSLHAQAQSLAQEWQGALRAVEDRGRLDDARALAGRLRLSRAIELAQTVVPASGAVYDEAQVAIAQWQRERDEIWAQRVQYEARPEPPASAPVSAPVDAPTSAPASAAPVAEPATPNPSDSPYYGYYGTAE
ncbi:MAG: hypothetical protein ACFB5Z_09850 [Elainellaceae cyanobacterium]